MNKDVLKLLKDRYFLDAENTWEELAERVGKLYEPISQHIKNLEFVPSSPTLMNANTNGERKGTLSSCFPMNIDDSMDDIMESMKEVALVTKACGGVGIDFSVLRGKNEGVKGTGKNSGGVLSFIGIYDAVLTGVRQGVRRGAGMSLLSIYHPQILEFIEAKKNLNEYNRSNFSIKIDNHFYSVLKSDPKKLFKTINITNDQENILKDSSGKEYTYEMLWEKIIEQAWSVAEPGIINEDFIKDRSTLIHVDNKALTNPCLPKWSKVLTEKGIRELKDINIGDRIWSTEGWTTVINKWSTGIKKVWEYQTTSGYFYSTDNHKVISKGEKIEITNAKTIQKINGLDITDYTFCNQTIVDGLVIGNGSIYQETQTKWKEPHLFIGANDKDYFESEIKEFIGEKTYPSEKYSYKIKTNILREEVGKIHERNIPVRYFEGNNLTVRSFLRGLYSANGSVCGDRVTLKSSNFYLIQQVQMMLSGIGISSYVTTNKSKNIKWKNGNYTSKQSYDLNISTCRTSFYYCIGFIQKYKMNKLEKVIERITRKNEIVSDVKINAEVFYSEEEVFDITVDNDSHTFWCNGFNISNCSEFVTTVPYTSCNLGSIDVSKFVKDKAIDYVSLNAIVRKAVRYLNSVIDNNNYPLEKIKKVSHSSRPIGLGMMGFAHALYKMEVKYDSLKAKEIAEDVMKFFTLVGTDESCIMAKEKGDTFEWYNKEVYLKANERLFKTYDSFTCRFGNIVNKNLLADIEKYGVYNSSITSIAPTGSISTIVNSSSGIEPVFGLVYIRKVETGNKEYTEMFIADPVFEKFIEEKYPENKDEIYAYVTKHNGSVQGCKYLSKEEKEIFVVASDITPEWHLEILEPFANYVSLSVSKTINMPKEATKEQVAKVYIDAYTKGVIGVTVYRDGCREGILIHSSGEEKDHSIVDRREAPKRPQDLECDIKVLKVKSEFIVVLVGKFKGMIYEMFVAGIEEKNREKYDKHTSGIIRKVKTNHYRLICDDETLIDNLGKFGSTVERSLARFISMSLRHGVPLKFIVEQLNKSDDFTSFDKSVSRVLKQYIKDGEIYSGECCPECKSKLVYFDGCIKCSNCFYSKCG